MEMNQQARLQQFHLGNVMAIPYKNKDGAISVFLFIEGFNGDKNEPMEFDPGTQFKYNNSGYILLGHIIEVVSGESYADFIQANIFDKVDMTNSYYGSMPLIIPNRASGYSETDTGYRNAEYLSLTLPYAAGSIMSTTGDLLKWQNAISANTLIKNG